MLVLSLKLNFAASLASLLLIYLERSCILKWDAGCSCASVGAVVREIATE